MNLKRALIIFIILGLVAVGAVAYSWVSTKNTPLTNPFSSSPTLTPEYVCEDNYSEILTKVEENYAECSMGNIDLSQCTHPNGTGGEPTQQVNVELILDSSGSMAATVGGGVKMDIAKEVMTDFVTSLPEGVNVALRVYGHKGSNADADKALSCASSELIYAFQQADQAKFTQAINSFKATGWTPIATSLHEAKKDLINLSQDKNVVYLVSDGIETCDGDPVAAAKSLKEQNINTVINVVGFDVDNQAQAQLRQIAEVTGGTYFDAKTADDMRKTFQNNLANIRAWQQYALCVQVAEQQFKLKNVAAFQQYRLCIQRKADKEKLSAQHEISKLLQSEEIDETCSDTLRKLFDQRENKMEEQVLD